MKLVEITPGMRIIATASRGPQGRECWIKGDEFMVAKTSANEVAIECRHTKEGQGIHPLRTDAETAEFEEVLTKAQKLAGTP